MSSVFSRITPDTRIVEILHILNLNDYFEHPGQAVLCQWTSISSFSVTSIMERRTNEKHLIVGLSSSGLHCDGTGSWQLLHSRKNDDGQVAQLTCTSNKVPKWPRRSGM